MKFFISVSLFNTSTLLGQFVSPKTREKKERSKGTGENWKTDQNEEKVNNSEEKAEIKTSPLPYLPQAQQALPNYKPISVECPDAKRYITQPPPSSYQMKIKLMIGFKTMRSHTHQNTKEQLKCFLCISMTDSNSFSVLTIPLTCLSDRVTLVK